MNDSVKVVVLVALCAITVHSNLDIARAGEVAISPASTSATSILDDEELERAGAVVGEITIVRLDVFDPRKPEENKAVYRLANLAHIDTRERLIRDQLLFAPGDRYTRRLLDETERSLRTNKYIYDVHIQPERFVNGVVDLTVVTQDVWTLTASASLSRSGGQNNASVKFKELNLLGTGIGLELGRSSKVDRDSTTFRIVDNNIAGSRYGGFGGYASSTDGSTVELGFGLPFYALDTPRAGSIYYLDDDRVDQIYDLGAIVDEYRHLTSAADFFVGRSAGLRGNWVTRYSGGIAYEEHLFSSLPGTTGMAGMPGDRRFLYPFIGIEILENDFEEAVNLNQIQRPEDIFMGMKFAGRLGYSPITIEGSGGAWLTELSVSTGLGTAAGTSLLLHSGFNGRLQDGDVVGVLASGATFNWRQSKSRALNVSFDASIGSHLDLDQALLLGGDTGLRGYPLRYQRGDKLALLSIEQRFFTQWQPLRLFNVGAVAFFDVGRVWGGNAMGATDAGILSDVGIGLRLGNRRSGSARMIHLDLAMPLNETATIGNFQILFGADKKF